MDREAALALDAADPLAPMRSRFVIADPDLIYLDGNSLGRLAVDAEAALHEAVTRQWGERLVRAWPEWIDAPTRVGDVLAAGVLGAEPGEVLVGDSTTVNLFKLAAATSLAARAADPRRTVIVTNEANFPTDRYVLGGVADLLGLRMRLIRSDELDDAIGPDTALLCLSHVEYDTGERRDLGAITENARSHGVRVLWDLSHSAGSVPVQLAEAGAELAVGCTYKYLNAGPGAPAYLYVRRDLQPHLQTPIKGWFGQQDQFDMERDYVPAAGIRRFAAGTPPILRVAARGDRRRPHRRGGDRAARGEERHVDDNDHRAGRRLARPARLSRRHPARPGAARRPCEPRPRISVAALPGTDRGRGRHPRLPGRHGR